MADTLTLWPDCEICVACEESHAIDVMRLLPHGGYICSECEERALVWAARLSLHEMMESGSNG